MSWFTGAVNAFASGAGGAVVNSTLPSSNPGSDTDSKTQDAAKGSFVARSSSTKNGSKDFDDVLRESLDGNYGTAWEKWCDATKSDRDPVTGQSRNEPTNGSEISSTDRALKTSSSHHGSHSQNSSGECVVQ